MTGFWGDIPFTEATGGDQGVLAPAYDTQKTVYDSLLANLAAANTMMNPSGGDDGFKGQDPVYAGDMAKWKKFANSLRARLGMNLSKVDAARARSEVAAAVTAGGFADNSDNAQINWPGDGTNDNPWYDNQAEGQGTRDDGRFSVTFIDTLSHLNDPRLPIFARPKQDAGGATYVGMPNGLEAGAAGSWGTKASRLGPQVFAADQPSYIMTYAEFSFIKAEAANRGWISGNAAQFYIDGITASMKQWGVADADIATYLAQPRIVYQPGAAGLAQIGVQKWISLFTQGYEAWSEWRRTGYPNLTPALNARTSNGQIPRRIIYPQTEQSFNNTHLQAAITNQGGSDALTQRLWIDP
jgi:Starch-binding associating with outer membrane